MTGKGGGASGAEGSCDHKGLDLQQEQVSAALALFLACVKLSRPFPESERGQGKREKKPFLQATEQPVSSFCSLFTVSTSALLLGEGF